MTPKPEAATPSRPDRRSSRRRRYITAAGAAVVGALAFVVLYFEPQSAFIDDRVSETLPGLAAVPTTVADPPTSTTAPDVADVPVVPVPDTVGVTVGPVPDAAPGDSAVGTPVETAADAAVLPADRVAGALVTASETGVPVVLSTASFFSGEHDTSGTALVVALPEGGIVVRFEGLDTSNGPDLRVVLSPEPASESWQYDDRVHLGELKGNLGDQNYELPDDVDITGFRSVVIWCERFSVAFGAASVDVSV